MLISKPKEESRTCDSRQAGRQRGLGDEEEEREGGGGYIHTAEGSGDNNKGGYRRSKRRGNSGSRERDDRNDAVHIERRK